MKSAPWSIARRLSSLLTAALTALWLAAVVIAIAVVNHETNEVFDSALQETAQRLVPLVIDDFGAAEDEPRVVIAQLEFARHEEYLVYQVRDAEGHVLLRSHDAPEAPFPAALRRGHAEGGGWRFFTERYAPADLYVQVGEPLAHRREALYETMAGLLAPLAVLIPLAGVVIFWTVRLSLKPLAAVRAELDARGGADLSPIPDATMPRELSPIIADVNRLLARLAKALASERSFAANSAHELRTPVAAALAQTQRLASELQGAPQRERVERISITLNRLSDLVEKLLQLARADAGIALNREVTDVLPAIRLVVEEYQRRSAVGERLRLNTGGHRAFTARIDIDALAIVLRNLIDNALNHGAERGAIGVILDDDGALRVVNEGSVVPPERLAHLKERFERAGAAAPGAGLGLAIVDSLVTQAGGSLELLSPARGRRDGFEAVLRLDLGKGAEVQPGA